MKRTKKQSRRDFMRLLAAGSAAVLAVAPAAHAADATKPAAKPVPKNAPSRMRRARTEPGAHPFVPEELEKQKKYLADSLKVIRDHVLSPGNAPAFTFHPLAQKSRKERRS